MHQALFVHLGHLVQKQIAARSEFETKTQGTTEPTGEFPEVTDSKVIETDEPGRPRTQGVPLSSRKPGTRRSLRSTLLAYL